MKPLKVLITGAGGMLGRATKKIFSRGEWEVIALPRSKLDVADREMVKKTYDHLEPDITIHLAAFTDVDRCETEPDAALSVNYLGTWYLAQACAERDAVFVYLSSDLVFDGCKGTPYLETDPPSPLNVYGKSKLAGENIVRNMVRRHYILRAGWMFGGSSGDHKFAGKIISQVLAGKTIKAVVDRIGSPIYTGDLAAMMQKVLRAGLPWGTYHIVNRGLCSRFEMARFILDVAGFKNIPLLPVSSSSFPTIAPRPVCSALEGFALARMGMGELRPWQEALAEYVQEVMEEQGR